MRIKFNLLSFAGLVFALSTFVGQIHAQSANTMYFMKGVPQSYQVNPAYQSGCNFFIGFPALAPLQLRVSNSSFGFSDAFTYNSSIDSIISFLHPLADKNAFLALLKDRNFIQTEVSTSIASFGIGKGSTFFSFDIRERVDARISYPDDLLRFPIIGPDSGMFYDFNGLGVDVTVLNEFSMGISQKIGEKLSIGWRGKLLFGQANLRTEKTDLTFSTIEDSWPVHSSINLNATLPFANIVYDANGMIDFDKSGLRDDLTKSIPSLIFNPLNFGLAMDIGVDLRLYDWLQLSGSLVDLGSVKWTDYVYNMSSDADFEFQGIEVDITDDDFMQTFVDSLEQAFKFKATETPYKTWLPTKLFLGAAFYPHPRISFGLLSRTEFYEKALRQQFTASANFYPLRMLSASFSYSILEGQYKNLGIGLGLNAGPFNFYLLTDTAPSVYFWPLDARYVNLKLGLNLVFGCQKLGKVSKPKVYDKPLVD